MIATADDARLIFSKWKDTTPPIQVKLRSGMLVLDAIGTVADFSPSALQLAGNAWQFTIPLANVSYAFSDPREIAVASVRDAETAKYEFGLSLRLPNGDDLLLMELKATPREADWGR